MNNIYFIHLQLTEMYNITRLDRMSNMGLMEGILVKIHFHLAMPSVSGKNRDCKTEKETN